MEEELDRQSLSEGESCLRRDERRMKEGGDLDEEEKAEIEERSDDIAEEVGTLVDGGVRLFPSSLTMKMLKLNETKLETVRREESDESEGGRCRRADDDSPSSVS